MHIKRQRKFAASERRVKVAPFLSFGAICCMYPLDTLYISSNVYICLCECVWGCIYRWQSFQFRFQHKYAREKFADALAPFGPLAVCLHYDPLKWLYGEGYETLTRLHNPQHSAPLAHQISVEKVFNLI